MDIRLYVYNKDDRFVLLDQFTRRAHEDLQEEDIRLQALDHAMKVGCSPDKNSSAICRRPDPLFTIKPEDIPWGTILGSYAQNIMVLPRVP